jgi:hypothetical protein
MTPVTEDLGVFSHAEEGKYDLCLATVYNTAQQSSSDCCCCPPFWATRKLFTFVELLHSHETAVLWIC